MNAASVDDEWSLFLKSNGLQILDEQVKKPKKTK